MTSPIDAATARALAEAIPVVRTQTQQSSALAMFVVYDHPADHPNHWVVRAWSVQGQRVAFFSAAFRFERAESAREVLEGAGFFRVPRWDNDDPNISEVWL